MSYPIGSTVIHPQHGPAKIVARTKRTFNGKKVSYLELEVTSEEPRFNPGMKILIVEDSLDDIGVRDAASSDEADDVLVTLANVKSIREPANWSRRFKNHTGMLATGDIFQVAAVVRNLFVRNHATRLSAGERTMLTRAEHLLAAELAVTWGTSEEDALARIHAVMLDALGAPVGK